MNDRQIVTLIATGTAAVLFGAFWGLGAYFPQLRSETAFAAAIPVIIAIAVLAPTVRGIRR